MNIIEKMTIFGTVAIAYFTGFFLQPLLTKGILSPHLLIRLSIFFFGILTPIITLALILTSILSDDGSETREAEWQEALNLAKLQETRITEKLSPILLKEAKDSFNQQEESEKASMKAIATIKANHIVNVWNQLFQEEKDESQE